MVTLGMEIKDIPPDGHWWVKGGEGCTMHREVVGNMCGKCARFIEKTGRFVFNGFNSRYASSM